MSHTSEETESVLEGSFIDQKYPMMKLTQELSSRRRAGAKRAIMELLNPSFETISPSVSLGSNIEKSLSAHEPKNPTNEMPLKKRKMGNETEENDSDIETSTQEVVTQVEGKTLADQKDSSKKNKKVPEGKIGIQKYMDNDVLCGRGGGTNAHPGNREFRDMINLHRRKYLKARKNDKPAISRSIVQSIREKNGRFLKKDEKTGLYYEIGDDNAREKTSQALRQRASQFRQVLIHSENEISQKSLQIPQDLASLRRFLAQSDSSNMGNYYSHDSSQNLNFNHPHLQQQPQPRGVHLSLSQLNSALAKNSNLLLDQLTPYQDSPSGGFPLSLAPNNNCNNDPSFFNSSISRSSMVNLPQSFLRNHSNSSIVEKKMHMHHMSSIPSDFDMNPQLMYLQQQIPLWTTATLLGRGRNSMTNHTA